MRFVKQRDASSCAPIAILNALKWATLKVTLKDLKKIKKMSKTTKRGTYTIHITETLKRFPIRCGVRHNVTIKHLNAQMKRRGSFILYYKWPNHSNYHTALFIGKYKNYWLSVNFNPSQQTNVITLVKNNYLKHILTKKAKHMPMAWMISRFDK